MSKRIKTAWTVSIILLILLGASSPATPQVYRWTDEKGTIHFSDSPSGLPKDSSVGKKRDAEKKEVERIPIAPNEKAKPERGSVVPSGKPRPGEATGTASAQPVEPKPLEPVQPTGQDMVFGQIKPTEQNLPKQGEPGEGTPATHKIELGTASKDAPHLPGGAANRFGMKSTFKVGAIVGIFGMMISIVGGIWFLVAAFKVSIKWGLACLFLPFAQLIFLFSHWKEVRKPFAVGLLAMGVIFVAAFLMVNEPLLFLRQYTQ